MSSVIFVILQMKVDIILNLMQFIRGVVCVGCEWKYSLSLHLYRIRLWQKYGEVNGSVLKHEDFKWQRNHV